MSRLSKDGMMEKWKLLSGSSLKVMAMTAMVMDHAAFIVLSDCDFAHVPYFTIGRHSITLMFLLRGVIGRLAFPLFAFLIVEGFIHTRNEKKYIRTMLIFALLTVVPWYLVHGCKSLLIGHNVLFTFTLALTSLYAITHLNRKWSTTIIIVSMLLAWLFHTDYGFIGVAYIILLYMFKANHLGRNLTTVCVFGRSFFSMSSILSIIPMEMYNGKRGFIQSPWAKYAFYAFYPLHLLVLYLISTIHIL